MPNKKVIIIGAGIAGLSAGCYLQMNGYDTEIFESHYVPGGLCTGWKRKGYTFDGCIHWLGGSGPASPFYKMWNEIMDMKTIEFVNHDLRFDIELDHNRDKYGSPVFHLYAGLNRLEQYMKDIAPEDAQAIDEFIGSIRELQKYSFPPLWDVAPEVRTFFDNLKMVKYLPFLIYVRKWSKVTNYTFAERLKNPFLKEAFQMFFEGKEFGIIGMTMQLAIFDQKCGGFPIGGSLPFAGRFQDRYVSLGGQINYRARVKKILVENDIATGIQLESGETHKADIVISAADGHFTIFEALDGKYVDESIIDLYNLKTLEIIESMILVSLGIARTFEETSHLIRFPLTEPLTIADDTQFKRMEAHIYKYDPTLAPEGKTVVTVTLYTRNHEYWTNLCSQDHQAYEVEKERLAQDVIERLDKKFGDIKDNVQVIDVATPATIVRYTNNWQGSYQGWYPPTDFLSAAPLKKELPGLENFYMIGQWVEPGGGLPPAAMSGRNVAQIICKRDKRTFTTTKPR